MKIIDSLRETDKQLGTNVPTTIIYKGEKRAIMQICQNSCIVTSITKKQSDDLEGGNV